MFQILHRERSADRFRRHRDEPHDIAIPSRNTGARDGSSQALARFVNEMGQSASIAAMDLDSHKPLAAGLFRCL